MKHLSTLSSKQTLILLVSLLIASFCGIIYELIISSISSYLLGNSVYQFSVTIGFFMFAMGMGAMVTKYLNSKYIENFITIEIALAFFGGLSGIILFVVFPYARAYYEFFNLLLIFVIGALVGMEIPLLTTVLSTFKSTKKSIADIMSFDYVGALIGALIFPIFLLPKMGLIQSSFFIGVLNLLAAAITSYFFWDQVVNKWKIKLYFISVSVLIVAGLIFSESLTRFAEKNLYFDQIVLKEQTQYQKLIFTRSKVNSDHRLYIDGHIQFSSRDEYRYHEFLVHPILGLPGNKEKVLVLGGGDGLALREILKYPEVKSVTLVDIDQKMIDFGSKNATMRRFNLSAFDDPRVTSVAEDAFTFLNRSGDIYDRIIIDLPDPHNEALNKLYSVQFYKLINRRLSPDGYVATQGSSPFFTPNTYWTIEKTLQVPFDNTASYHFSLPSFGIWGFHVASNKDIKLDTAKFPPNTRAITTESLMSATVFPKDISKPKYDLLPNSIMKPNLYILYSNEVNI